MLGCGIHDGQGGRSPRIISFALRGQRDPADERQVLVSLTDSGRRLREKGLSMNFVKASGLTPENFIKMQKGVVTLRGNLIKGRADRARSPCSPPTPAKARHRQSCRCRMASRAEG